MGLIISLRETNISHESRRQQYPKHLHRWLYTLGHRGLHVHRFSHFRQPFTELRKQINKAAKVTARLEIKSRHLLFAISISQFAKYSAPWQRLVESLFLPRAIRCFICAIQGQFWKDREWMNVLDQAGMHSVLTLLTLIPCVVSATSDSKVFVWFCPSLFSYLVDQL